MMEGTGALNLNDAGMVVDLVDVDSDDDSWGPGAAR